MSLGIVCGCEGLLDRQGIFALCRSCGRDYPLDEVETILKLLRKADYQPASTEQSGPTKQEKRSAINIAARKLSKLGLRVIEITAPPPVLRPTIYQRPTYATSTNTTTTFNNVNVGYWYIRVPLG